jgi:cell wall-associated NlpC family hydrolase
LALRISVRAGETVVGWATSFLGVPYEMGGGWYGGRADNDWDSSDNDCGRDYRGDHQYGIDCNGLIWSSFNLAGI